MLSSIFEHVHLDKCILDSTALRKVAFFFENRSLTSSIQSNWISGPAMHWQIQNELLKMKDESIKTGRGTQGKFDK